MNNPSPVSQYLLMFRGNQWDKGLSPEELQNVLDKWMDWFTGGMEQGRIKGGQPLLPQGKIVSGKRGQTVADGPFAESKEAIGGYFLLQVDSMDEALAIARQCPALDYGMEVEVRPVAESCPIAQRLNMKLAGAMPAA